MTRGPSAAARLVSELSVECRAELGRFLAFRVGDRSLIDDLAQEVYLRLLRLERVHLIRNPRAYLFRVASSVIADHGRRQSRRPRTEPWGRETRQLPGREPDPFEHVLGRQRLARIQAVVDELPERCRRALILQRRDGWTYDEIAIELGVSRSMVKKYLRRALILCRRALDRDLPTAETVE